MNDKESSGGGGGAEALQRPAGVRVAAAKCVRCSQPVQARYRPFCSQRCAEADLGAWVTGAYRVPTEDGPDDPAGEESSEDR